MAQKRKVKVNITIQEVRHSPHLFISYHFISQVEARSGGRELRGLDWTGIVAPFHCATNILKLASFF